MHPRVLVRHSTNEATKAAQLGDSNIRQNIGNVHEANLKINKKTQNIDFLWNVYTKD